MASKNPTKLHNNYEMKSQVILATLSSLTIPG